MDVHNIPHMRLFYQLKQKFPDLKDNDVNESIQKFGLNRDRCIEDLEEKSAMHHGGYYGPWGQSHTSPTYSNISSTFTSPQRELTPTILTTTATSTNVLPTLSPTSNIHNTTALHFIKPFLPIYPIYPPPQNENVPCEFKTTDISATVNLPSVNSPTLNSGWDYSMSNDRTTNVHYEMPSNTKPCILGDETTYHQSYSAPIISMNSQPFTNFSGVMNIPERRHSEETKYDTNNGLHYNKSNLDEHLQEALNINHSNCTSLQACVVSGATMTTCITTTSPAIITQTTNSVGNKHPSWPSPPALVEEQTERKNKLTQELSKGMEERVKLEGDLGSLHDELQMKEKQRKETNAKNAEKISNMQMKNRQLQSLCDQMEAEILDSGETPETEQDAFGSTSLDNHQKANLNLPCSVSSSHTLNRTNSSSSLNSRCVTPPRPAEPGSVFLSQSKAPTIPTSQPLQMPLPPPPLVPTISSANYNPAFEVPRHIANDSSYTVTEDVPITRHVEEDTSTCWSCSKCTFNNHLTLQVCEICFFPRYNESTDSSPNISYMQQCQQQQHDQESAASGPCYCHSHQHKSSDVSSTDIMSEYTLPGATGVCSYNQYTIQSAPTTKGNKPNSTNLMKHEINKVRKLPDNV